MDPDTRTATAARSLVSTGRVTEITLPDTFLLLKVTPRLDIFLGTNGGGGGDGDDLRGCRFLLAATAVLFGELTSSPRGCLLLLAATAVLFGERTSISRCLGCRLFTATAVVSRERTSSSRFMAAAGDLRGCLLLRAAKAVLSGELSAETAVLSGE